MRFITSFLFCLAFIISAKGQTDYLMIGDFSADAVPQFNISSGQANGYFLAANHGGLDSPSGLVSGNDGQFYVTSQANNRVLVMEGEDGSFIRPINTGSSPVGIVLSPAGNLLVAEAGPDRISAFDVATGSRIGTWNSGGGLNNPASMCYGPDSALYVGSRGNDKIARFNAASGAFVDNFVPSQSGGLARPGDFCFRAGFLYVSSRNTDEVLRYDASDGSFVDVFVSAGLGGLNDPVGLYWRSNGHLLVASLGSDQVLEYDAGGAFVGVFVDNITPGFIISHTYGPSPQNLIINPGAETDPTSDGWTALSGSWQQGGGSNPNPNEGDYYFYPGAAAGTAELYQDIDLSADAGYIDAENLLLDFRAYLRAFPQTPADAAQVVLEFLDADENILETYDTGQQTNTGYWRKMEDSRTGPIGTRSVRIRLLSTRYNGTNNNGYIDNLLLTKTILGAPLPVSWKSFEAKATAEGVLLHWETSLEENADFFAVERSANGRDWWEISQQVAQNTSTGAAYEYLDRQLTAGRWYYRIRQIDIDDQYTYSAIREISWQAVATNTSFTLYPNPAQAEIFVQVLDSEEVRAVLWSMIGQAYPVKWEPAGEHVWRAQVTHLPKGSYFLEISGQRRLLLLH